MGGRSRPSQTRRQEPIKSDIFKSVREKSLDDVALSLGLQRDKTDKKQFIADGHRISINGDKFNDFNAGKGGGGAIDLVMHVRGVDFNQAVDYLGGAEFTRSLAQAEVSNFFQSDLLKKSDLPMPSGNNKKARDYLINQRGLSPSLVDEVIKSGLVFQDINNNVAFKYGDNGAELRGTLDAVFHGFRGDKGEGFVLGDEKNYSRVVVVESAIDVLSYKQLHDFDGNALIISVGGNSTKQAMQNAVNYASSASVPLISAFDADNGGDVGHSYLTALSTVDVVRFKPQSKDWNNDLLSFNSMSQYYKDDFSTESAHYQSQIIKNYHRGVKSITVGDRVISTYPTSDLQHLKVDLKRGDNVILSVTLPDHVNTDARLIDYLNDVQSSRIKASRKSKKGGA